jgi:hypothetical protein
VIEHGEAVSEIDRIVQREERDAGPEPDAPGEREHLGDEQVGRWRRLPALGQMLADPRLEEPQLVGANDLGDVPVVAVGERPVRRVQRHHEQPELHARLLLLLPFRERAGVRVESSLLRPARPSPQSPSPQSPSPSPLPGGERVWAAACHLLARASTAWRRTFTPGDV